MQERYKQKRKELEEQLAGLQNSLSQDQEYGPKPPVSGGPSASSSLLQVSRGELSSTLGEEEEEDEGHLDRLLVSLEARIRRKEAGQSGSSTSSLAGQSLAPPAAGPLSLVNPRDR